MLKLCVKSAVRSPLLLYVGGYPFDNSGVRRLLGNESVRRWAAGLGTGADWIVYRFSVPAILAVAMVNWLATLLKKPQPLPRMDFSQGIPQELRTLVVVPTMLTSTQNIEDLIEALEVRFLANRDDHLHFGLLTDFRDASEETLPEDNCLLQLPSKESKS